MTGLKKTTSFVISDVSAIFINTNKNLDSETQPNPTPYKSTQAVRCMEIGIKLQFVNKHDKIKVHSSLHMSELGIIYVEKI